MAETPEHSQGNADYFSSINIVIEAASSARGVGQYRAEYQLGPKGHTKKGYVVFAQSADEIIVKNIGKLPVGMTPDELTGLIKICAEEIRRQKLA
jgi:hypothetical protein